MLAFLTSPDAGLAAKGSDGLSAEDGEANLLQRIQDLERAERDRRFERNAMRAEADSRAADFVALRKRVDSLEIMDDRFLAELADMRKRCLQPNVRGSLEEEKWQGSTPRLVMDATHLSALSVHFEANFVKIPDFLGWVRETHDVIGRLWEVIAIFPASPGIGSGVLDSESPELALVEETTAACQRLQQTVQTLESLGLQINSQRQVSSVPAASADSTARSDVMEGASRQEQYRVGTADGAVVGPLEPSTETIQAAAASEGKFPVARSGAGPSRSVAKNRLLWNPDSQS